MSVHPFPSTDRQNAIAREIRQARSILSDPDSPESLREICTRFLKQHGG